MSSEESWMRVVGELAGQPFPDSLRRAVVELGVALHRGDVTRAAMQGRIRSMMTDPTEAELPVAQMREWPEYAAQEEARVALHDARRSVEGQARAWVSGEVGAKVGAAAGALLGGADKHERETTLPPESEPAASGGGS